MENKNVFIQEQLAEFKRIACFAESFIDGLTEVLQNVALLEFYNEETEQFEVPDWKNDAIVTIAKVRKIIVELVAVDERKCHSENGVKNV